MAQVDTLLILDGIGIPQWSARGLTQTLTPIAAATNQRRTINGTLKDLSYSQFRKYSSKITCTDQRVPSIDGLWPGMIVTVYCVAELALNDSGLASRPMVSGSSRVEGDFIFYRPILWMQVTVINTQVSEWKDDVQWEIDLEEI